MRKVYLMALFILLTNITGQSQVLDTLINVGNHQLHFKIILGKGTPILFEAGNGDDSSAWESILNNIHDETGATLITYDRAGLGKSGIDTTTISFQQEIKDLQGSLRKLGFGDKYFLVAHSFGSFYASAFSHQNTGKINGAVFIDVATPCSFNLEYTTRVRHSISKENWELIKKYKPGLYYVLKELPEIATSTSEKFISDSIPLTVIAAEIRKPSKEIGETQEDVLNMTSCLKDFGNLANHKYLLAPGTEHRVWMKSPELVVQEISILYKKTSSL